MVCAAVSLLAMLVFSASPAAFAETGGTAANPIRKVVQMLTLMQKKVAAEGEKEAELYAKFECWCSSGGGALSKSIADAGVKVPALQASIEAAESKKVQLEEDVKQHQADRAAAKASMKEATAIREKEAAAFAAETAEDKANIDALERAVAAISAGMAGGFLQTGAAQVLRKVALAREDDLPDSDREALTAFLSVSNSEGYAPASGQIVGILKQMGDTMAKELAEATAAEEAAIKAYKELMAAKTKEVAALTKSIEEKLTQIGTLGVEIAEMKNDLSDTEAQLIENKKFLEDLEATCAKKKAEWEERTKTRAEELVALADTIKVLNDDDALELFKKTLPSASASLVQVQVSADAMRTRALAAIQAARGTSHQERTHLDFITLALRGKKVGFEKVIKMIDDMVTLLKGEQVEDDNKKEYCAVQFDAADDSKKKLERGVADLEKAIASSEEGIATTKAELEALAAGIVALDKQVAEATEQRKSENEDYTELMAQDTAAKDVLAFAKNRLNKFYNPKLYVAPPKRELSEADRIVVNQGGTLAPTAPPAGIAGTGIASPAFMQVASHRQQSIQAPPPPPETFGAYAKKSEGSTGVIAMIDLLVKDLDKEMTEATAQEKDSQGDYVQFINDSAEQRAADSKSITEKESLKADLEASLQAQTEKKASTSKELAATLEYIASLHAECDWLMKFYDVRKEARAGEIDALGKAKAILSGADYSLIERASVRTHLRNGR